MSMTVGPMDENRVYQRDEVVGNPPGFSTTFNKGWGIVDVPVNATTPSSSIFIRLRDSSNHSKTIQDWIEVKTQIEVGQNRVKLSVPASLVGYVLDLSTSPSADNATTSSPFFVGNVDAAAGQSKALVFFDSYEYQPGDFKISNLVPLMQNARVFDPINRFLSDKPLQSSPSLPWLPPGDSDTPGGAYSTTFAAEYLRLRIAETGVACGLIGAAAGGTAIAFWTPGGTGWRALMETLPHTNFKFSTFIWCQGDADEDPALIPKYDAALSSILDQLDSLNPISFKTVLFDYTWRGGDVARYGNDLYVDKQEFAAARDDTIYVRALDSTAYFGGHPTMLSRERASRVLARAVRAESNPAEDRGPSLTGKATRNGRVIDLQVHQDQGTRLLGTIETESGLYTMSYVAATGRQLASQFSVFERGHFTTSARFNILSVELIDADVIRIILTEDPHCDVEVWYRADEDDFATFPGGPASRAAIIRDDVVDADGIPYGRELQAYLAPIAIAANHTTLIVPEQTGGAPLEIGSQLPLLPLTPETPAKTGLSLKISEDAHNGDVKFRVSIDGVQVGTTFTTSASHMDGQISELTLETSLAPGQHNVSVTLLNGHDGGTVETDRHLYLDGVYYNGKPLTQIVVPILGTGTRDTNIIVPHVLPDPIPDSGLVLRLSEDALQGDAQFTIKIDGVQVGGIYTTTASHVLGEGNVIVAAGKLAQGIHDVSVSFLNHLYLGTSAQRNLYIEGAFYNGTEISGVATKLTYNGSTSFSVATEHLVTIKQVPLGRGLTLDGQAVVVGETLTEGQFLRLNYLASNGEEEDLVYEEMDTDGRLSTHVVTLRQEGGQKGLPALMPEQRMLYVKGAGLNSLDLSLPSNYSLQADGTRVTLLSIPDEGSLFVQGSERRLAAGDTITVAQLENIRYLPPESDTEVRFEYLITTSLGTSSRGVVRLAPTGDEAHKLAASSSQVHLEAGDSAAALGIFAPVDRSFARSQLQIEVSELPTNGILTFSDGRQVAPASIFSVGDLERLRFTPGLGSMTPESAFSYTVVDPAGNSAIGRVSIIVSERNSGPTIDPSLNGPFAVTDLLGGRSGGSVGSTYEGPVDYLERQFLWSGPGGVAICATEPNSFIHGGLDDDALQVTSGHNVLDGGGGSNFLIGQINGSGGADVFFVDARVPGVTWSTIVNFHAGDEITIWGFKAGVSKQVWEDASGASGYKGFTLHSDITGQGNGFTASVTMAGFDRNQAALHIRSDTGSIQGIDYLHLTYV